MMVASLSSLATPKHPVHSAMEILLSLLVSQYWEILFPHSFSEDTFLIALFQVFNSLFSST